MAGKKSHADVAALDLVAAGDGFQIRERFLFGERGGGHDSRFPLDGGGDDAVGKLIEGVAAEFGEQDIADRGG